MNFHKRRGFGRVKYLCAPVVTGPTVLNDGGSCTCIRSRGILRAELYEIFLMCPREAYRRPRSNH